jgi:hypothetical protein
MSLAHSNAVLEEKAAKLVDHLLFDRRSAANAPDGAPAGPVIVSLYRNAACRGALHSFRDRVGVPEVILVALPKRLRKSRRYLFDHVTECNQFTGHVVRGHARLDSDQAWPYVHKS